MGLRFRGSIRIAKGLRLNLSKSGLSMSAGGRGSTLNLGSKGVRGTVGIPGSGLSYSHLFGGSGRKVSHESPSHGSPSVVGVLGMFGLFFLLLGVVVVFGSVLWGMTSMALGVGAILLGARVLQTEQNALDERIAQRRTDLAGRFDQQTCERILAGEIWLEQTAEQLKESLGEPADVDEKVLKTKRREVWTYGQIGANRFRTCVTLENGIVTGWDSK